LVFQPGEKGLNSRAVIDACRPFEWMKDFPPVAESSPELKEKIYNKWKKDNLVSALVFRKGRP